MTDLTVANTILAQLGGARRLGAMISARDYIGDANSLTFGFPGSRAANKCRITLDGGSDTYKVEFFRTYWSKSGVRVATAFEAANVYAEDLIPVFERGTDLHLHLPGVRPGKIEKSNTRTRRTPCTP